MPTRIRELPNISQKNFSQIAQQTLRNFNYDSGTRSDDDQLKASLELLEEAW